MTGAAPQLVILDCDGVLVDSEVISVRVDAEVVAELGWPLTEAEVAERYLGGSYQAMVADIEANVPGTLEPGWDNAFDRRYREAFEAELQPVAGVLAALDRITLPTCVASSGSIEKMRLTLGLTGLWERFEGRIYSADDVEHAKPAPDLFLHAATAMGVDPERCVVVEDSRYGVQAAVAAGMRVLGYSGGLTAAETLRQAGATPFADMRELPALVGADGVM